MDELYTLLSKVQKLQEERLISLKHELNLIISNNIVDIDVLDRFYDSIIDILIFNESALITYYKFIEYVYKVDKDIAEEYVKIYNNMINEDKVK